MTHPKTEKNRVKQRDDQFDRMANAKRHDHHRHHHHRHQNIHNQKTIFLPMFCRLSIDDVKLNDTHRRNHAPAAGEPSSPKVSCMGQVKRHNRVIAYPGPAAKNPKHTPNSRASRDIAKKSRRSNSSVKINDQDLADVADMDPPLPVVKRVASAGGEVNLWKRRFNGDAGGLKSLEIQNIHSPECKFRRPETLSV